MQGPTLTNVRIVTIEDAEIVFYAVKRRWLQISNERLSNEQRMLIAPGNVYVWEERTKGTAINVGGIERWTDGKSWGQSRVRDEFLFYHERECDPGLKEPNDSYTHYGNQIYQVPDGHKPDYFIKQTYSVLVDGGPRKWHLTTYFKQDQSGLYTVRQAVPELRNIVVPAGMFQPARLSTSRSSTKQKQQLHVSTPSRRDDRSPKPGAPSYSVVPTPQPNRGASFFISLTTRSAADFVHSVYSKECAMDAFASLRPSSSSSLDPASQVDLQELQNRDGRHPVDSAFLNAF